MSSRNNRMVRNREKSSNFSEHGKKVKIFVGIAMVIFLIAILGLTFLKIGSKKKAGNVAEGEENILAEYFLLSNEENVGVIDKKGNLILPNQYTNIVIPNPSKPVFIVYTEEKSQVVNQKGEPIFGSFEQVEAIQSTGDTEEVEKQVLKYKKDNLYGLMDLEGTVITEAIYEEITSLNDRPGRILVKKENQYGVLDYQGNTVITVAYDQISADGFYSDENAYQKTGYIVAKKTKTGIDFGYIDYQGNTLLEPKYETLERALEYDEDDIYLIAMQKGKKGVFKNKKKWIDLNFQEIHYSNLSKVFIVNKNGKYGFYRLNGKMILKPEYTDYSIAGNYISVTKEDKTELFDINGNLVGSNSYTKMIETENPSYFIAEDGDGYYSIISKDIKINEKYIQVSYAFHNFFIFTDENGKSGVVNALTKEVEINPEYDFILLIDGTKSLQAIDGMKNTVDIYSEDLRKTITMEDGIVEHINEQYSICYSENDMRYFNSSGQVVENVEVLPNQKWYAVQQEGNWGFADQMGKVGIDCQYDIVTEFNQYGFAGIKKDGKWGVVDEEGNIIVEPTYELDTYYFPQFIGKYLLIQSEITYCEEV